jgi:hypothetical protein
MPSNLPVLPPEDVTPEWLTAALAQRDIDVRVSGFRIETVGTGQLGETRRFHLEYAGAQPPDAPRSVVGKFSSANPVARDSGRTMGWYRNEVMFYQKLAARARLRTPLPYVAELDELGDFVLLFEDLAPAWQGDQMKGCSVDEARLALVEAAMLHAAFWNDRVLEQEPWLNVPSGSQAFYSTELVERSWDNVRDNYQEYLTPEVSACIDRYVRNHADWNRARPEPRTYQHCDFRPDNMLFGGADGRVALVDWQTGGYLGSGMDVAYFLSGCFDRDTRRRHERALLQGYHADLERYGITGYSFDHLLDDYRHYSFAVITVALTATLVVKRTERGDRMLMHMAIGGAHQAIDNQALDLLPP